MSANIPFDIQVQIIKRVVTAKSLIRFRSVSKQWKSLIDSSEFVSEHIVNQTRLEYLLVRSLTSYEYKYVTIVDDDSFPDHKFSPYLTPTVKLATNPTVVDSSHGLVCLNCFVRYSFDRMVVLWNPSIRKSVGIQIPSPVVLKTLGFGVCPKTCDPKIVMIKGSTSIDWKAEVFSLSSRVWTSVSLNYRPLKWLFNQVVIDGVIHWVTNYVIRTNNHVSYPYRIISFNLTSEEFGEIDLPDCLAGSRVLRISKLYESLAVLNYHKSDPETPVCDVWMMMKSSVQISSFTKVFSVNLGHLTSYRIIGFGKNGQAILRPKDFSERSELKVYERSSECIKDTGIYGTYFTMRSYKESLLLLNHSDSIIEL